MAQQQQYNNNNTGMLYRNHRREAGTKQPDMTGFVNIGGVEYWVSGWTRDTPQGGMLDQAGVTKFVSLAVKPKEEGAGSNQHSSDKGRDEQRYERQPERAARAPAREERQPARQAPARAGAFDDMDDDIPF